MRQCVEAKVSGSQQTAVGVTGVREDKDSQSVTGRANEKEAPEIGTILKVLVVR